MRQLSGAGARAGKRSESPLVTLFLRRFLFLTLFLLAACGGGSSGGGAPGGPVGNPTTLTSIAITPANPNLQVGASVQLIATGTYANGTTADLSTSAAWTSNAQPTATVAPGGRVSGVAAGSATISASVGGISSSTVVTVASVPVSTLSFIHYFQTTTPNDGGQPNGPLLQASDGNFYTTTRAGGTNMCPGPISCGAIVRLSPAGAETVLYSFGATATDGRTPSASLIQGSDGALYGTTASGGAFGGGTVFRITLGGAYSLLYSFGASPSDGVVPVGALVQGSDGNFYGTTASGGANHCSQIPQAGGNCGTVFRMMPAGVVTILHSFGASLSDGVEPLGALVLASDGNFYGTTIDGGANNCASGTHNCGTVFRMTPAGAVSVIYSFGASAADGLAPQGSLIQGSDGALYGTTPSGGGGQCGFQYGCGTVFRITTAGSLTILHAFAVNNGRLNGYGPSPFLIQASDGNFYGTTRSGGTTQGDSTGTVFRLTPTGIKTILYSFGPLNVNPSDPGGGLTQGSDGAFYGVTFNSGGSNGIGTVFKLVVQ
jgi:uncharacterized repeat protein (TIGR03803 family)